MSGFSEEDIEESIEVAKLAVKRISEKEHKCSKKEPKIRTIEINANSKEDAIKQIKSLELEKNIEEDIIKIIQKD
jgi:hypothetical protein